MASISAINAQEKRAEHSPSMMITTDFETYVTKVIDMIRSL